MKFLGFRGEKCLPILAFSLVAFTALPANAQAVSGNVFGTVTDPSGGAVANAKVTIANVDTNVSTTTNTNDSGNYTATQLAPGNYKITIEKAGFNTFIQENIPVSVSLGTRVDATLTLGQVTQQVTVTEAPPELQSDRNLGKALELARIAEQQGRQTETADAAGAGSGAGVEIVNARAVVVAGQA